MTSFPDWLERTKQKLDSMMSTTVSDVVAWVIEHPDNGNQTPLYWGHEEGQPGWTSDIRHAFRFDTQEDAEHRAGGHGIPDYRIVDHKWLAHGESSNS